MKRYGNKNDGISVEYANKDKKYKSKRGKLVLEFTWFYLKSVYLARDSDLNEFNNVV